MLTLAAALLCMEESLNRFESTSNEREMTVKALHVPGKHEWNPNIGSVGEYCLVSVEVNIRAKLSSNYPQSFSSVCGRCHYFSNLLAEVADMK
jgi:hypothetical protein